jgi:hypothetical protein
MTRRSRNNPVAFLVIALLGLAIAAPPPAAAEPLPVEQLNIQGGVHKVDCLANNFDTPERTFASGLLQGLSLRYRSSREVDYGRTDWPTRAAFAQQALVGKLPYGPAVVKVVVVDVRNVNGIPHYGYYSNGSWNELGQNWSSTKVLAELAAIHKLRLLSNFRVGAEVAVDGTSWAQLLRELHEHSSNAVGEIFKFLAGRDGQSTLDATSFVRGWLARPDELFNGGYGGGRADSYFRIDPQNGQPRFHVGVQHLSTTRNLLTPLAMAEFWKRIGVNRRDDRLMPKGANLTGQLIDTPVRDGQVVRHVDLRGKIDSYRHTGSTADPGDNEYAPAGIADMRTTITLNDLYVMMYGRVDSGARNDTHDNGMVWDAGFRGRFNEPFLSRAEVHRTTGGRGKLIGKTGSNFPSNSAFGGHICLPDPADPGRGVEFAFFILGHGFHDRGQFVDSDTVVKNTFRRLVQLFAGR